MQQILALSRCAVIARHWFEIDLDDASMEHGARIELRELVPQQHRGSESAAQIVIVDRPLWRADLFDRVSDSPGSYGVAHFHPEFSGNEPCPRAWDAVLTASPWDWLHDQVATMGAASGRQAWPLDPDDVRELGDLADMVVAMARQFAPESCGSAAECFRLTRDVRESVQLMMAYLRRPDLLDEDWVAPWRQAVRLTRLLHADAEPVLQFVQCVGILSFWYGPAERRRGMNTEDISGTATQFRSLFGTLRTVSPEAVPSPPIRTSTRPPRRTARQSPVPPLP